MREYDDDDYNIRRYAPVLRRAIILVAVIIAVPVMMWTITIFIRSYVERPKTPTFRHLTLTEPPPKPQAAQRAPAPLLSDAARTAGDGLASLPDPNSGSLKGSLALPPGDAPPPAASPTGPAETAPNAPAAASGEPATVTDSVQSAATAEPASSEAVTPEPIRGGLASLPDPNSGSLKGPLALPPGDAPPPAASPTGPAKSAPNAPAAASGEAAAVTDSAQSAATAETASSEAATPEPIRGRIPLKRDQMAVAPTATGPVTGNMAPVGPVPLPRVRPVDAPVDTPPVPTSPPSGSPLLAHPAAYGYQPGLD